MHPVLVLVSWVVYFGLTAAVIVIDRNLERAKAAREGTVDFADRSVAPYLLLSVLCGPLPLIFYFGTTRKSALAWLGGIGAAIAVYAITVVVVVILQLLIGVPARL